MTTMRDLIEMTHVQVTWGGRVTRVFSLDDYMALDADELAGTVVRPLSRGEAEVAMAQQQGRVN